mmetsp:Transcript_48060/g.112303  ORF Transcript_48060/g.112303 Transcript_48060/m.112303 type:complete len:361 (-) Transcript_48060:130-1212(-)
MSSVEGEKADRGTGEGTDAQPTVAAAEDNQAETAAEVDLCDMDLGELLSKVPRSEASSSATQPEQAVASADAVQPAENDMQPSAGASSVEPLSSQPQVVAVAADPVAIAPADAPTSAGNASDVQTRASFATYGVAHYHLGDSDEVPSRASYGEFGVEHYQIGVEEDQDPTQISRMAPPMDEDALEARRRMAWLGSDDQKTVCRRECELARRREEALMQQLNAVADYYLHVLELSDSLLSEGSEQEGGEKLLDPEVAARYQERVQLLRGTAAALATEPVVSLPKLTTVERMKGFTCAAYAHTATVAKQIGDNTGATDPVVKAASGAISAFGRLSARWRPSSQTDPQSADAQAAAGSSAASS